jgi:hypothetical protein
MTFRLVEELAADEVLVVVASRILGVSTSGYYATRQCSVGRIPYLELQALCTADQDCPFINYSPAAQGTEEVGAAD